MSQPSDRVETALSQRRIWAWRLASFVPSLVVLFFGLRYSATVPLWGDELWVWDAVRRGPGIDHGEPFQLPLYTMEWALTGGGSCLSETCLRWPGLAATVINVWLVGHLASLLAGRAAGLIASILLMAIALPHRATLEAHHYAVAALLVTIALWMLQTAQQRPSLRWPWVAYAAAMILAGTLQPVALVTLVGQGILVAGWRNRDLLKRWLVTLTACSPLAVIAVFVYLRSGTYGSADTHGELIPSLSNVGQALIWPVSGGTQTAPFVGAIAGILFMLGVDSSLGRRWMAAGAVTLGALYVVSLGPRDFWFGRFMWPTIAFFIIAAAVSLAGASRWRILGVLGLVAALSYPLVIDSLAPWSRGPDVRTGTQIIDANWRPGDLVEVGPGPGQWALDKYGSREDYPPSEHPTNPTHPVWSYDERPPCADAEEWVIGPEISLWRCPPVAQDFEVTP